MTTSKRSTYVAIGVLVLALTVGALVVYKATSSLAALAEVQAGGAVEPKAELVSTETLPVWLQPLAGAVNYLSWVLVALFFGILIGALVRSVVPSGWLARSVGARGWRGQLAGAVLGAPLMLCSCCVAPVFEGVYQRTRRLGAALGLMLAAPALNPAALALTFLLFPPHLGWVRLVVALLLVLGAAAAVGRTFEGPAAPVQCVVDGPAPSLRGLARGFAAALGEVTRRSVPAILLGIIVSAALVGFVPIEALSNAPGGAIAVTLVVAAIAVPIALPTFAEIPLALALLHAGAPDGAVLALLVAGPAVNLPSLFTLRALTSWRVALATGASVFAMAAIAGVAIG